MDRSLRIAGGPLGFLLVHGLGGTPAEMTYVALRLARAGHTVHVPQLAGHCAGADQLKVTTWQQWYESVDREHIRLRETCDRVIVGGLSAGAILALHHAARHTEDVSAAVLYAPTLWLDGWGVPWHARLFRLVLSRSFANLFSFAEREPWGIKDTRIRHLVKTSISSGESWRAGIAALPGAQLLELRWLVQQVKDELVQVPQPVLVMHPRHDDRASLRNLEYLQAKLNGPVEAVVLDDSYHVVTLDRQRALIVERTLEFASRVSMNAFAAMEPHQSELILSEWLS